MASTILKSIYDARNVKPADLLDRLNPLRLHPHGRGVEGIGSDPAATGPFYVFVTTPDLNLEPGDNTAKNFLALGTPSAPTPIAKLLQGGTGVIKLLTNVAESIAASDIVLDIHGIAESFDGAKLSTPRSTLNSRQDGTLQVEYQEWSGLPVTLLHKIWIDYIEGVTKGIIFPKNDYVTGRVLDYASSIYYFQCLPDASTIEFGVRFTGCFPTAVPLSPWNGRIGGSEAVKVSVPYSYSFMEAMDHAIFTEFNTACKSSGASVSVGKAGGNSQRSAYRLTFDAGDRGFPTRPQEFQFL